MFQQAGTGKNRDSNNAEFVNTSIGGNLNLFGSLFVRESSAFSDSVDMDVYSVRQAKKEIDRRGGDIDLLVVYLPGLDHYRVIDPDSIDVNSQVCRV